MITKNSVKPYMFADDLAIQLLVDCYLNSLNLSTASDALIKTCCSANYLCINENKVTGRNFRLDRKSSDFHKILNFWVLLLNLDLAGIPV